MKKLKGTRQNISLWLPVFLWAFVIFLISTHQNPYSLIPKEVFQWLQSIKIFEHPLKHYVGIFSHLIEFGILAFLLARALFKLQGITLGRFSLAFFLTFIYALTDELHQHFVPGRAFQVVDLLLDSLGAILGLGIYTLLLRRQKHK